MELLERADRATNPVTLRWFLNTEIPLLGASVMLIMDPKDAPVTAGDVAETIRGLNRRCDAGAPRAPFARLCAGGEPPLRADRKGLRANESLAAARRDTLAAFVSGLKEEERG